jgi:hypothetical protein
MEEQKMSSQERIYNNILDLHEQIQSLDKEIESMQVNLKKDGLSDDEKKTLEEDLQSLTADRQDLSADVAMLEELLNKMELAEEERTQYDDYEGGGGLDWNESGYFD